MRQVQNGPQYGQPNLDMSGMAGALPHPGQQPPFNASAAYGYSDAPGATSPQFYYQMQHAQQFQPGRGMQQYGPATQGAMMNRPHLTFQPPGHYGQYDPFNTYNMNQMPLSPVDPRVSRNSYGMPQGPMGGVVGQYVRRASDRAPIPSFPRGPPRKPKQSGHALWVGNLPPAATIVDLKDHFSRDATKDIESLFLISKSNCAFVNYRSEASCVAAMNRFHDSRFHGVRLVCRLRRGAATGPSLSLGGDVAETPSSSDIPAALEEPSSPTIVGRPQSRETSTQTSALVEASGQAPKVPEKFFVVKSLTVQDLESSVRNSTWATQSHNENALNRAYQEADNVYLIFSANKSGEYFGYARMASKISGEAVSLGSNFTPVEPQSPGVPQSISTSATATAPKGRIIDDSARGTIFWEAEHSDDEEVESLESESGEFPDGQNWGMQFTIEWLSQTRLPFYRTRGLRNPWNANREVKIARDGTEIEPSVGRRLVQMFHGPGPQPGGPLFR